ncbi:hypothetical protein RR46_08757 [Papilio xuthus]|uniref:Uncharacterized protein n=1 Tax=Papilio xuthus TaxID=66420 RepID=A0A194PQQ9_PAPXU|nr:hypothetical protein RR46_08757 [Papilio xuthus]
MQCGEGEGEGAGWCRVSGVESAAGGGPWPDVTRPRCGFRDRLCHQTKGSALARRQERKTKRRLRVATRGVSGSGRQGIQQETMIGARRVATRVMAVEAAACRNSSVTKKSYN